MKFNKTDTEYLPILNEQRLDDLKLTLFCEDVNNNNPTLIDNQKVLKALMDKQFETSFKVFNYQFIWYICFYFMPMLYIFTRNDISSFERWLAYLLAFVSSLLFFLYEIIQYRSEGKQYFYDIWNYIDIGGFLSFWLLFFGIFHKD